MPNMKKIVFEIEMVFAEDCPNELPRSKKTYEDMIMYCIRQESSEKEIVKIKSTLIDFEGITFKEEQQ